MFYAYVLKRQSFDFYYKGHCHDLDKRLKEHNGGMTTSTRPYLPFTVAYFEEFVSLEEAIKREKYFKSAAVEDFLRRN
jgi:putative endonuclease